MYLAKKEAWEASSLPSHIRRSDSPFGHRNELSITYPLRELLSDT